jgi:hypothetical protein
VRLEVVRWMGSAPSLEVVALASADAEVQQTAQGFRVSLVLRSGSGELHESLVAPDCRTLADVVALKLAVAMDPAAIVQHAAPSLRSDVASEKSSSHTVWGMQSQLGLDLSALGRLSSVFGAFGSLTRGLFRAELGLRYGLSKVEHREEREVGVRLDLIAGTLRGCAVPQLKWVAMPLCLGLELGVLRGRGFGVKAETSNQWWQAVTLGTAAYWPVGSQLAVVTGVEGVVTLARPGYQIENLGWIHRTMPLGVRGLLGLEVSWR